jgi:hypothetical protein
MAAGAITIVPNTESDSARAAGHEGRYCVKILPSWTPVNQGRKNRP